MVAEGWRKIATYIYLILNGELELNKDMVLLIDEPEANLNPALIETLAKFLNKLASKGVQIFLTTHNHLLPNYLSWNTDFKTENSIETRFFGLSRLPNNAGIEAEMVDSFYQLQNNPILEASLTQHEEKAKKISEEFKKNKNKF
jgi:predicted ATPase